MTSALEQWRAAPVLFLDLEGRKVAYRRFGHGPAIVLIHGWPLSGITYRALVAELSQSFTCYVPDLPGAGDSPPDPNLKEFFGDFACLIGQFVDAVGLDRFALVGHDSGGAMARVAAAQLGKRVTAMVLTNTEVPGHVPGVVKMLQYAAALPLARPIFQLLLGSRAFLRSAFGFGGAFQDKDLIDGEFRETACAPLARDVSSALLSLRRADLNVAHTLPEVHAAIHAPLLCLWGDADPFFSTAGAETIVEQWAGPARLERIPGKKLLVHEEVPTLVAAHIAEFVGQQAPARLATPLSA